MAGLPANCYTLLYFFYFFTNLTKLLVLIDDDKRTNINIDYTRYHSTRPVPQLEANVLLNALLIITDFIFFIRVRGRGSDITHYRKFHIVLV